MKFRNKILLSIYGVVLSLLVITFFIINYWTRGRIEESFSQELRGNYSTLKVFVGLQSEILLRGCQVIAESPRLRAVAELRDPQTAFQLSQELHETTVSDLFVLTDFHGQPLAQILYEREEQWDVSREKSIRQALAGIPTTDVWGLGSSIYRVASAPIRVEKDLIGTLTIGFDISLEELATLKGATNSEIVLIDGKKAVFSTLSRPEEELFIASFAQANQVRQQQDADTTATIFTLTAGDETYLGTSFRMNQGHAENPTQIAYLLVKPVGKEISRFMTPIFGTFALISLIFLILTTIIGQLISRGITRPINELVRGTSEVSKGNYDYAISVAGKDELSFLAQKFGEMSGSLKDKITELDRLNQNLLERNLDLDETLKMLKEAQEELVKTERLAATGKLTAQLAHEINNPIHNIQSCLKTSLTRLPGDAQGRELIEVAFDEITRMSKLTRQMLDFYRTALVPDEMRPVNLVNILREVLAASQEELTGANIALKTKFDTDLPEVNGSKDKLKQVFLNIVLNAKDAMPSGGTLTIATFNEDGFAKVQFVDTGIGIPKENLNKIFDAFFTTKGKVSGVGLGLSVSYGIINQHRGIITAASKLGEGSTFTISLPLISKTVSALRI